MSPSALRIASDATGTSVRPSRLRRLAFGWLGRQPHPRACFAREGEEAGGYYGVRSGSSKANEMVQRTISSDERRDIRRSSLDAHIFWAFCVLRPIVKRCICLLPVGHRFHAPVPALHIRPRREIAARQLA